MHLVIDDQSPIIAGEEREMREILSCRLLSFAITLPLGIGTTIREYLIGADCYRANFFAISRVLTYHLRWDIRLVNYFLYPLPHCYRIGLKDHRTSLNINHSHSPN